MNKIYLDAARLSCLEEGVDGLEWDQLIHKVQSSLAAFIGCHASEVTLYHNTTAAVQRIFTLLNIVNHAVGVPLLTTDIEYPGIISLADEQWAGPMVMVPIADHIWRGECAAIERLLLRAFLRVKPRIVYLSHVARDSGYVMPASVFRTMRDIDPSCVLIADGAQAVGNLKSVSDVEETVDFYIGSGHKWLGGLPTLGFVVAKQDWKLNDPAQGYSLAAGSRGTGSLSTLNSLLKSLVSWQDVGVELGLLGFFFAQELERVIGEKSVGILNGNDWSWSGIVAFREGAAGLFEKATAAGVMCSHLTHEDFRNVGLGVPSRGARYLFGEDFQDKGLGLPEEIFLTTKATKIPNHGIVRFCFDRRHTRADVKKAVARFENAKEGFGL